MPKARRLPSGAWNIQAYSHKVKGKRKYESFTADTKAEVEFMYAEWKAKRKGKPVCTMTVKECLEDYINLSRAVLSPTTLYNYEKVTRNAFQDLMDMPVKKLTDRIVQEAINKECERPNMVTGNPLAPKTVINYWNTIAPALRNKGFSFKPKLPSNPQKNIILPKPLLVLQAIQDEDIFLPSLLAMWCSLRLSEVRGIKCSDIKDDILCINQVIVRAWNKNIEKANAKTTESNRMVKLPPYIMELINNTDSMKRYRETGKNERLIECSDRHIQNVLKRCMTNAELDVSFKDFRHYFATISLILGATEKVVQATGGWSSPSVMMRTYFNVISGEQLEAFDKRNEYFSKMLNEDAERKNETQ